MSHKSDIVKVTRDAYQLSIIAYITEHILFQSLPFINLDWTVLNVGYALNGCQVRLKADQTGPDGCNDNRAAVYALMM